MALIVMKFGGSSVADKERIENVSSIIEKAFRDGNSVIAVLSAQGDMTDLLLEKAYEISKAPDQRETDMLLSTGEQISVALCAMALKKRGIDAVSLTGWQAGLMTSGKHGDADIMSVSSDRINEELKNGRVIVLAGFQGVDSAGDITTLGRGGSDTTAVCAAAFFGAQECILYKDVEGVYTADPKKDKNAVLLSEISYDDMLRLIEGGSQVIHKKCVEIAKEHKIQIKVLSSFCKSGGTTVK